MKEVKGHIGSGKGFIHEINMAEFYKELASCQVAGVPLAKYKSLKTGLVVCTAQTEGPLINGYFCLGNLVMFNPPG